MSLTPHWAVVELSCGLDATWNLRHNLCAFMSPSPGCTHCDPSHRDEGEGLRTRVTPNPPWRRGSGVDHLQRQQQQEREEGVLPISKCRASQAHPAPRYPKGRLDTRRAAGRISPPPAWEHRRPRSRVKIVKMSTIPKHFGLKNKEESHMFKELEKVRQETKKDFLQFKQKLASKPAVDEGSVYSLRASSPAHPRCVSYAGPPTSKVPSPAKGPEIPAVAILQKALGGAARPSGRAAPANTPMFQPQDFYLRSSPFLRHRAQKKPPVIASGVGTAKPVVLLPPPTPRVRPSARGALESPRPAASRRDLHLPRGREASREMARSAGACKARESKASSLSSEESDAEAGGRRRRVRIRTYFVCEGEGAAGKAREAAVAVSRAERESGSLSDALEAAAQTPLPARAMPTSIEEIIVSLQSEAQLASDQIITELIQSVLGQNYDIKVENMLKELPKAVSSMFQTEQEDIEWGALEAESTVLKPQEISEVQPAVESSKPLEDGQPKNDAKAAKHAPLKAEVMRSLLWGELAVSMEKEHTGATLCGKKLSFVVNMQVKEEGVKDVFTLHDEESRMPQNDSTPHLHDLCTTVPARELPIDLRLASRVYHTADKKGHDTLLGVFGTPFLNDHFTDEEQKDR
ncbi:PREDICTED: LOW QUALITY PROTEIN: uncharacterized protein LOC105821278 [Propithecus coquereli]|uniref:LOW QUALITY PROTEIN: uncharacterized protein LOC105821278 n=1 Tax=Propithecus coquereli TaxID=379532 RepID=UPI00063EDAE9|nr:PREDICTED: LOW QUALITY PROTEIN: uncharacterized protein LOC105821278 [Propithecus coquereli]